MKVLVSGICAFVGSNLVAGVRASDPALQIFGLDNLVRPRGEINRTHALGLGVDANRRRPFDVPWLVLDTALAAQTWNFHPATLLLTILEKSANHHPEWSSPSPS